MYRLQILLLKSYFKTPFKIPDRMLIFMYQYNSSTIAQFMMYLHWNNAYHYPYKYHILRKSSDSKLDNVESCIILYGQRSLDFSAQSGGREQGCTVDVESSCKNNAFLKNLYQSL